MSIKITPWVLMLGLVLTSCQPTRQTLTSLQISSLKAIDLEETLSRGDELLMAYSLTTLDANGKAVAVINGSWGVQETKEGQSFRSDVFSPIEIPLPKNGKVVASLVLVEIDDYASAQKTLAEIKKYNDYIKIPAGLVELADVALTPLKYISLGLTAAGVGFKIADQLDNDDILGQNSTELTYEKAIVTPVVRVPLTFKNKNFGDSFHYELAYDLTTRTVRLKPSPKLKF